MLFKLFFLLSFLFFSFGNGHAQDSSAVDSLRQRIENLENILQKQELEKLLEQAEKKAIEEKTAEELPVFKSKETGLQALNPEFSVIGDFYTQLVANKDGFTEDQRSGSYFRTVALHATSYLDPFSFTKISFEWGDEGAGVTEAYIVWINPLPATTLMVGKFRQQLGVVNRWHEHALDQFDAPLALTTYFGEEGLTQSGISAEWTMPSLTADVNQFTLQVTNSENEDFFSGEFFSTPSVLGHLKNYYDLNENSYLELGLTGLWGTNQFRGYENGILIKEAGRNSLAAGVDLTYLWEPPVSAGYKSFVWRNEAYFVKKELEQNKEINAFGAFSYAQYRLNERLYSGIRLDYTQPFEPDAREMYQYQIVPYLTWMQSEWVMLRLQYNYLDGRDFGPADQRILLHINWAAGPHLHERY